MGGKALSFVHSIASTDYPNLEIVVVDNASTDGSDNNRGRTEKTGERNSRKSQN